MSESKAALLAQNRQLQADLNEARQALITLVADLNRVADREPEFWPGSPDVHPPAWYWRWVA